MKECPKCDIKLFEYLDETSGFMQYICWKCGYYEDNSPAYRMKPELFVNIVRNNPLHFMRKYGTYQPTGNTNNNSREGNRIILWVLLP